MVTHTLDATTAIDERIKAGEEHLESIRHQIATLHDENSVADAKVAFSKLAHWFVMGVTALLLLLMVLLTSTTKETTGLVTLWLFASAFAALLWKTARDYRRKFGLQASSRYNTTALEAEETRWQQQIQAWREERRAFLISHQVNLARHDHVMEASLAGDVGGGTKECPACAEVVKAKAKVCRYCGFAFAHSA